MPIFARHVRRRLRAAFDSLVGRMLEPEPAVGVAAADELLRCPLCGDDALCPMHWEADGESAWWIRWRCGNCGVWVESVMSNRHADALDRALDRQIDDIRRAADGLERERAARVQAQVDAFVVALQRDVIQPADFSQRT